MSEEERGDGMVAIGMERPIWDRFFLVAPLVVVGTREGEGYDLAPKHMATPIGWGSYFGFVCSPRHSTYHNARRSETFTVSFPRPDQVVEASLAAQPRQEPGGSPPGIEILPTVRAEVVDGILLDGAHLHLECELDRIIDGFGENSLIVGRVVAARVRKEALRTTGQSDTELLRSVPILAYVSPGRVAEVSSTEAFPFPADFKR